MPETKCIVSWDDAALAADKLCRFMVPAFYTKYPDETFLKSVYNNILPQLIDRIFVWAFVTNFDRNDPYMVILLAAYEQLQRKGCIGELNNGD